MQEECLGRDLVLTGSPQRELMRNVGIEMGTRLEDEKGGKGGGRGS